MPTPKSLLGAVARQPARFLQLKRIRESIYTTLTHLDASIVRSNEPIPFPQLTDEPWEPLPAGTAWGKKLDCAWIHVRGTWPVAQAQGRDPVVLFGLRGEALIHSPAGEPIDGVTSVWLEKELPDANGKFRPVRNLDISSGAVDFYADAAYNGFLIYPMGRAVYHGAQVALRDDDAHGLYYDYLTLVVLADQTTDTRLAAEIWRALDMADDAVGRKNPAEARAELSRILSRPSTSEFTYQAIGHGHLDMAWLWPLRETRRKAARTYTRQLNSISENPGYIYGTSQPQQLAWMKAEQPALYARVKDAITQGRIELQGAFWIEPDTNLPSGESLVRQALVGRRFLEDEFGINEMRLCWLPDTFGYSGNLPQILKKSGMDWFQTIKLSWNKTNTFPHRTFHWRGIDGSQVLVHMPPEGNYNSRADAESLLIGLEQYPERELGTAMLAFGYGDGGGGPGEFHHESLARVSDLEGLPRVESAMAASFFRDLETRDVTHVHDGELYLELHQGTYTTQAAGKRHNRVVERLLHEAEALAAIVGEDSRAALESAWREVLLLQFHDILPGSSIGRVHREANATYERIESEIAEYSAKLRQLLPRTSQADGGAAAPTALNLTSFARREHVKHGGEWFVAEVGPYAAAPLTPYRGLSEAPSLWGSREGAARDETSAAHLSERSRPPFVILRGGRSAESQNTVSGSSRNLGVLDPATHAQDDENPTTLNPATLRFAALTQRSAGAQDEAVETMSNGILDLVFGQNGEIVSCRTFGGEHAAGGLGRLVLHKDAYQFPWDAWDVDESYLEREPRPLRLVRAETFHDGPTLVRRQLLGLPGVVVDQRVILEEGSAVVRFATRVNWRASHRMLRAEFRPSHYAPTAKCEIQFGHIERATTERDSVEKAQFEICAHKWLAVEDSRGGFAVLNDSKYGHRAKNGLISLNLLRAPTFPDKTADRGVHHFTYAFMPFAAGAIGDVVREGYRLNNPLIVDDGASFTSVVSSSEPGVVVETLKAAEDGSSVVLRLYESLGCECTTTITTSLPHTEARFTNLLEHDDGPADLTSLSFTPFEIKTILLAH